MSDPQRPHGLQPSQVPPSVGFSRQEYWSGVPLPSPNLTRNSCQICFPHYSIDIALLSSDKYHYSKVNQLNIYIYPLFFQIFPPVGHYTVLIQVPCAIKQVMVIYFIYSSVHWRRKWHPTPVLLCGKSHGWRSLVGCSPWGCKNSDTTG